MSVLTKDEILSSGAQFKVEQINIAALGGAVFVREVSAKEYNRITHLCNRVGQGYGEDLLYGELCAYFLSDADGKRMFNDSQFPQLGRLNAVALEQITKAGLRLNGLAGDEDPVGDAEKNSEATQ